MIASAPRLVTRRLIELAHRRARRAAGPVHLARDRQLRPARAVPRAPTSTARWRGRATTQPARRARRCRRSPQRVLDGLAAARGFTPDAHGATRVAAAVRALDRRLGGGDARAGCDDPDRDRGLMLLSVVVESDPGVGRDARAGAARARVRGARPAATRRCAGWRSPRSPSARRPASCATSCSSTAASAGARSTSSAAGCSRSRRSRAGAASPPASRAASTLARLDAAEAAGTLAAADAAALRDAFEFISALRMEHQVERLRAGRPPDDLIAPARADAAHAQLAQARVPRGRPRAARDRPRARAQPALTTELIPPWRPQRIRALSAIAAGQPRGHGKHDALERGRRRAHHGLVAEAQRELAQPAPRRAGPSAGCGAL